MPNVDTTGSYGHHTRHGSPILGEVDTTFAVLFDVVFTHQVDEAHGDAFLTFQLTNNGTGVQVITTGHPQTLSENAEVNTVVLLTVNYRVHRTVDVQQYTVTAAPLSEGGVSGETTG